MEKKTSRQSNSRSSYQGLSTQKETSCVALLAVRTVNTRVLRSSHSRGCRALEGLDLFTCSFVALLFSVSG
jgi:hypothetical protein